MEKEEVQEKPKKKYDYGDKYKGRYKDQQKIYHQKLYQQNKQKYKDTEILRRKRIKEALKILENTNGLKLKDVKV